MVDSGKTRDKFFNVCIRNIWNYIIINHIEGEKNIITDLFTVVYSKNRYRLMLYLS